MPTPLTLDEIRRLPAAIDLMTAARAFNLGRTLAYTLAREGRFPVPVQRHSRVYRLHTTDILNALTTTDSPARPLPRPQEGRMG
ncbi:DNA-binding protein [Frankia sp. CNm7]|uniref:DNA-binding protein n=2 Tax=Frankia nepalensis TaxID=1836974 RepID=A0A937RS92_9ACTN|nr:hypothetical protein [Frankia nepalensis]MBL7497547.1 DNA-binding protein [Frankia nepalensis]MBL7509640.1 DNA-binding protein [Frankia nepalensis]MBL7518187.1 DNA-binding protein [Frankia nepalensis]MBL7631001.1 DNA-binding protein [Frankia nepalensis]